MRIRRCRAPTEPPTTNREAPDDMQQHAVSDEDEENEKRWQGRSGHGRDNSLFVAMMDRRQGLEEVRKVSTAATLPERGVASAKFTDRYAPGLPGA